MGVEELLIINGADGAVLSPFSEPALPNARRPQAKADKEKDMPKKMTAAEKKAFLARMKAGRALAREAKAKAPAGKTAAGKTAAGKTAAGKTASSSGRTASSPRGKGGTTFPSKALTVHVHTHGAPVENAGAHKDRKTTKAKKNPEEMKKVKAFLTTISVNQIFHVLWVIALIYGVCRIATNFLANFKVGDKTLREHMGKFAPYTGVLTTLAAGYAVHRLTLKGKWAKDRPLLFAGVAAHAVDVVFSAQYARAKADAEARQVEVPTWGRMLAPPGLGRAGGDPYYQQRRELGQGRYVS